ncbi:DUF4350 domain-containing protein [Pollutibacter soli]|uniref:DUF4350 domain-containing protein n=1 Tax=Pollutibacter soli TaxID=3034157 RepID=UPI003013CCF1
MKWMKWYIIIILAILALYILAEYKRPQPIDWTESFDKRDKIPYGTYVLHKEAKSLFGTDLIDVSEPMYNHMNENEDSGEVYVVITKDLKTSKADENELLNYVANGNTVFLSALSFTSSLEDTLGFKQEEYYFTDSSGKNPPAISLVNPEFSQDSSFSLADHAIDGHFSRFDTSKSLVLGMTSFNKVNFLRINIGEGVIYIHAAPKVFTNYFILKDNNVAYVEGVLAYLPKVPDLLLWDDFYTSGRYGNGQSVENSDTPLRVILSRPALRNAYFVALATILIYLLFQSKRRQRIIPIALPVRNATLDFVETISRVYYNQRNHLNIALKKVTYLLDHIRTNYNLQTQNLDDAFIDQLSARSGVERERVSAIIQQIHMLRASTYISGQELLQFSKAADEFKKAITG